MDAPITVDKDIQGGTPCFTGTRVPVSSLFDHIEGGYTIDYFLSQFPSVRREQLLALIEPARVHMGHGSQLVANSNASKKSDASY